MTDFHVDYENGDDGNDGSDWANAWKTITAGATAERIAPGDRIKIAKSPDPVSIGDALWTHLSKAVVLDAALTLALDQCESGWTAANGSTVTHPTTGHKQGSARVNITKASYATSTLYAYKTIADTDFSDYEAITGFVRVDAAVADANRWVLCLCSDTAGATPVASFPIPAIPVTSQTIPFRLALGGALPASVQSIAVYTGTSAPTNGQDIGFDNLQACNDFSLLSLISKESAAAIEVGSEGWFAIQSIVGTTVLIDNHPQAGPTVGRGYSGATETVPTYRRETIQTTIIASGSAETVQDSGTEGSPITYSGGWDPDTDLQDGESIYDGTGGRGFGLTLTNQSHVDIERLSFVRYQRGLNASGGKGLDISLGIASHCGPGVSFSSSGRVTVACANNCGESGTSGNGIEPGAGAVAIVGEACGNLGAGAFVFANVDLTITRANNNNNGLVFSGSGQVVRSASEIEDNTSAVALATGGVRALFQDSTFDEAGLTFTNYAGGFITSHRHNGTDNTLIIADGGTWTQEDTDFDAPATASMWTALTSETTRDATYPLWLSIAKVAVVADKLVTIKAVMRKAHATNVDGGIRVLGGQIPGVAANVVATLADNTDEQELTLTFTPTSAGVVEIEAWAAYVAGHAEVSIDRLSSVTQAA